LLFLSPPPIPFANQHLPSTPSPHTPAYAHALTHHALCLPGLAQHLRTLLAGEHTGAAGGWAENSGWAQRVCRHLAETQGGLQISDALCVLSGIPTLVPTLLASDVFAVLHDVCQTQPNEPRRANAAYAPDAATSAASAASAVAVSGSGVVTDGVAMGSTPVRFRRSPQDWARLRLNAALTLRHCLEAQQAHWTAVEQASKFVSAPQALQLLLHLVQHECESEVPAADTLAHCAWSVEALAQFFPHHDGIASAFYVCDGVLVLGHMLALQSQRASALAALNLFAHDATRGDLCTRQDLPRPLLAILRQEGMLADTITLRECLR